MKTENSNRKATEVIRQKIINAEEKINILKRDKLFLTTNLNILHERIFRTNALKSNSVNINDYFTDENNITTKLFYDSEHVE